MAVLAAALRDAQSHELKMQALCAWRVFVRALAASGTRTSGRGLGGGGSGGGGGQPRADEEPLLGRVAQQAVVVLMEALEDADQEV